MRGYLSQQNVQSCVGARGKPLSYTQVLVGTENLQVMQGSMQKNVPKDQSKGANNATAKWFGDAAHKPAEKGEAQS